MNENTTPPIKKGKATEISQHIAEALVRERHKRQLTQRHVAEMLGVSFQQYQKYEKGKDRLSFEKATILAEKYQISLLALYTDGAESQGFGETEQAAFGAKKPTLSKKEQELLDIFASLPPKQQEKFLEVMRVNAKVMQ